MLRSTSSGHNLLLKSKLSEVYTLKSSGPDISQDTAAHYKLLVPKSCCAPGHVNEETMLAMMAKLGNIVNILQHLLACHKLLASIGCCVVACKEHDQQPY